MKNTKTILALFLFSSLSIFTFGQENIQIGGYVRNYTGILTSGNADYSIIQNTLNLTIENRTGIVGLKANPYVYQYFDRDLEFGLREAYLDLNFKNFGLRVGKQQIIYGKAEGVFITDVVSPKDLREFLLPDFDEIRMGVTGAKLNYYLGNHTFEIAWIPVFTPTQMPDSGSIWLPEMSFPIQPQFDNSKTELVPGINNSELFVRYSAMSSRIDYEIVAGYFYNDDPAMHIAKQIDPLTMQLSGLTVTPEYHRTTLAGGSFSMPVGSLILRAEGGYYWDRYFQTADPAIQDAVIKKDFINYALGIDYTFKGVRLSSQFIQEYIPDYEFQMNNDEFENMMTFLVKKDFLREKLWIELFAYWGLNNNDALIRPKITYSFADGFDVLLGANIFTGDNGRFGQYDDNDMVFVKFKYSF
jgi:hypothetical protein